MNATTPRVARTTRNPGAQPPAIVRPIGKGHPRPAEPEDEKDNVSPAFIAGCAAAFLLVGGAAMFLLRDTNPSAASLPAGFQSIAEGPCGGTWKKGSRNIDEMHCYMTARVSRLCDPIERRHLVATVSRFEQDFSVYKARIMGASLAVAAQVQTQGMSIGLQEAQMQRVLNNPNATAEQKAEAFSSFTGRMADLQSGVGNVLTEKRNSHHHRDLAPQLKVLIERGYIARKDFGRTAPDWVNEAFLGAGTPRQAC